MTVRQAFDIFARVTKQRLPFETRVHVLQQRPTIHGGGSDVVYTGSVSYASGDYASWPMVVRQSGGEREKVDLLDHALETQYDEPADRLAHVPKGSTRQKRAAEPKLDGQARIPVDALVVHARVEKLLIDLRCPSNVLLALLKVHPRDAHDPLNSGGTVVDRRIVALWITDNYDLLKTSLGAAQ